MVKSKNFIKYFMFIGLLFLFIVSSYLFAKNPLEKALKEINFIPKDNVIITNINNKNSQIDKFGTTNKKNRNEDLNLLFLKMKLKQPLHSINKGVVKIKKTQKKIEKKISKDIKKLFLLPKKIKVKSELKKDRIYTRFIYQFED